MFPTKDCSTKKVFVRLVSHLARLFNFPPCAPLQDSHKKNTPSHVYTFRPSKQKTRLKSNRRQQTITQQKSEAACSGDLAFVCLFSCLFLPNVIASQKLFHRKSSKQHCFQTSFGCFKQVKIPPATRAEVSFYKVRLDKTAQSFNSARRASS